jgi:transposase-like protein
MSKARTAKEIIEKLRSIDALIANGMHVAEAALSVNMTEMTYYRWRRRYSGLNQEQLERAISLQNENARLRRKLANMQLDRLILTEVSKGLLTTPNLRRAWIDHVTAVLGVSERHACELLGQHRSTQRKIPKLSARYYLEPSLQSDSDSRSA